MNAHEIEMVSLPAWTLPAAPDAFALWEAVALAGLEGAWLRLSAAQQRALMGHAVFGRQAVQIDALGGVTIRRATCFGMDTEFQTYEPSRVREAAAKGKKLSPGTFGPDYL